MKTSLSRHGRPLVGTIVACLLLTCIDTKAFGDPIAFTRGPDDRAVSQNTDDIGFLAAVVAVVGIAAGAFVVKNVVAAATNRDAKSLGSVKVDTKVIKFQVDDIGIDASVVGSGGPAPGSGNGFVTADGTLRFSPTSDVTTAAPALTCVGDDPRCQVSLSINVMPNLQVLRDPSKETGRALGTFVLSSPAFSTFAFNEALTDGVFNTPTTASRSFFLSSAPVDVNFHYRIAAQGTVAPEPTSLVLVGSGMVGLASRLRGRRPRP